MAGPAAKTAARTVVHEAPPSLPLRTPGLVGQLGDRVGPRRLPGARASKIATYEQSPRSGLQPGGFHR
jgi:hypothetical protein